MIFFSIQNQTMNFIFLFSISTLCYCVDGNSLFYKRLSRDFSDLRKDVVDDDLDQCSSVNFIMGQLGVVNVLAFLDSSWPFSYKQADMLKTLKDRLQKSGFPEALFFAITPGTISNSVENSPEDDVEKEAWERVSPDEVMEISSGLINWQPLETIISSDIFLIEDNDELGIWKELKGTRDQILIIDRCGKLAYQVIVPWSILHFPYVKAAIISTHKDDPCGACDSYARVFEFDDMSNSKVTEKSLIGNDDIKAPSIDEDVTASSSENDKNNYQENLALPIRIIMRAPHRHADEDSADKHEYLVLKTDETDYHGHLEGSGQSLGIQARNNKKEIIFDRDEGPGLNGEVADFWRDEGDYSSATENVDANYYIEGYEASTMVGDSPEAVTNLPEFTVEEEESRSKMIAHYSRLLPWIHYVLEE